MKSSVFRFKQFIVHQDQTAMKIGTDGVLLGAWAGAENPRRILDIGTGTGLIALMLAHRFPQADIDAVEIEAGAVQQARQNFRISPWKERLQVFHTDFKDFQTPNRYDLIVSNPPYFDEDYLSNDKARNLARHTDSLRLASLLDKAQNLLNENGSIQLILPIQKQEELCLLLRDRSLFLHQITFVKGRAEKPPKRILVKISTKPATSSQNSLVIEKSRHHYTPEYIELTKDFYLKM